MTHTFAAINDALRARGEAPIGWSTLHLNIPHFSHHYYGNVASKGTDGFGGEAHREEIAAALRLAARRASGTGIPPVSGATQQAPGQDAYASGTGILPVSGDPRISTDRMPVPHGRLAQTPMRAIERIYRAEAIRYLAQGRTSITCSALFSTVYLSEKGEVYPCTIWNKPLGNVRNTGFALMPIVEAARRSGVRQTIIDGRCPNCWTPCEAYSSICASPWRSLLALARGS